MAAVQFDVTQPQERDRVSVLLRIIFAIPHLIVSQIWGYLAQILAVLQWFIVLFTGKRNQGIWNLQNQWLGYYARVMAYVDLLYDKPYPPFGTDAGTVPVTQSLEYEEAANRLTNALRFIWVIPAFVVAAVLSVAATVVLVISWFAILITGKQPSGLYSFLLKALRYLVQTQAYSLLLTDTYPKYA